MVHYGYIQKRVRNRNFNIDNVRMIMTDSRYTVTPGPSLLELMGDEVRHAKPGFYKSGLVAGRSIVETWREGQQKPYHTLREHVVRCKRNNEDPEFTRGVATILAILIEPYGYLGKNDRFEITINYILSMED